MRKFQTVLAACAAALAATPATAGFLGSGEIEDCISDENGLSCEAKTVASFAVTFGLSVEADLLLPAGQGLSEPVKLELSKSRPTVTYPLIYHHTVPYHPREVASDLLFDGYRIGEPVTDYLVRGKRTQGLAVQEFELRPGQPVYDSAADPDFAGGLPLRAELLGDLAAYRGLPELDNFILYIPASPATHPFVEDWRRNALLVPREEVSYEGTECDKLGYIPKTRLARKYGLCLHNQLFDKHMADLQRLNLNPDRETTYLVAGMRAFKRTSWITDPTARKLISYEPPEIQNTQVVVITEHLEAIMLVTPESDGLIREAAALVDPFAAHSRDGSLSVEVENVGHVTAGYIVEVTNCNGNIVGAIPAQARTLQPLQAATLFFDLYTTGSSAAPDNACSVTLKSPRGRIYHQVEAVFGSAANPAP